MSSAEPPSDARRRDGAPADGAPAVRASPHVVILAGGIGSRFWPASTPERPKQLLALAGPTRSLLEDAIERARVLTPPDRIHILAGEHLAEPFRKVLGTDPGEPNEAIWVEPRARGTAPVLAWAAHRVRARDPDGVIVSLHADHRIEPIESFSSLILAGVDIASRTHRLLTVAVTPDRPETGYGWIRPGAPFTFDGPVSARQVDAFVEKPDLVRARQYLADGLLWNSGIFIWRVDIFLDELRRLSPEVGPHLDLLDAGEEEAFFDAVTPISVDEAVLERSDRVGMIEASFEWDDIGSWEALARIRATDADEDRNVTEGPRIGTVESKGNVVWNDDDGAIVLFGVEEHIVVRSGGITVVAPRARAAEWKTLVDRLSADILNGEKRK